VAPELRQLRYFVALAEELNFTRAARRAHIGQQGLSAAIRSLERSVGVALVERDTHQVALTAAGEAFLVEARRTLTHAELSVHAARRAAGGQTGQLRIGYVGPIGVETLPMLISDLHRRHPDLQLVPREMWSTEIAAALAAGRLDVGLARFAPAVGLAAETIRHEPLLAALVSDHPLAGRSHIALHELAGERLLVRPQSDGYNTTVIGACRTAGFDPELLETPVHGNPALGPVADGRAFALASPSVAALATDRVTFVKLTPPVPTLPVVALWTFDADPAVDLFLTVARELAQAEGWLTAPSR